MSASRSYHHGDLKRALIEAALEIAREEGADQVSLRGVSRRAGVSAAAPYHHFPDRTALIAAVAEEGFRALAKDVLEVERTVDGALQRLQESGVAYVAFAVSNPEHFRLMFSREIADTTPYPDLNSAAAQAKGVLERAIAACRTEGAGQSSSEIGVAAAWALVHGLATLIIDGQLGPEVMTPDRAAAISREAIDSLWRGLTFPRR